MIAYLVQTLWALVLGGEGRGLLPWSGHCGLGWDCLTFVVLGSLESGEISLESPWEMELGLKVSSWGWRGSGSLEGEGVWDSPSPASA